MLYLAAALRRRNSCRNVLSLLHCLKPNPLNSSSASKVNCQITHPHLNRKHEIQYPRIINLKPTECFYHYGICSRQQHFVCLTQQQQQQLGRSYP
mmetsp:Transcript_19588/g.25368  ORF Transcript_19588/g.25368 Transcript_19588/m.25368 type:complete len:95 (+) Transcript_19588:249-533(+)